MRLNVGVGDGGNIEIVAKVGEAIIDARHDERQLPGTIATALV